jgi:sirohydrochlorin ferrochelatase
MSHALLVVSHGSRRTQSNDEVIRLADKLATHLDGKFAVIHAAFLELADPSIPEGIQACIDAGASRITIIPYFLAAGRHVVEDIPEIVSEARKNYPDVEITITSHLGGSDFMSEFLASTALNSL